VYFLNTKGCMRPSGGDQLSVCRAIGMALAADFVTDPPRQLSSVPGKLVSLAGRVGQNKGVNVAGKTALKAKMQSRKIPQANAPQSSLSFVLAQDDRARVLGEPKLTQYVKVCVKALNSFFESACS
jgi:hypothetical protein